MFQVNKRYPELLVRAAIVSMPTTVDDQREFWLGCVGVRKDGAIVSAKNGSMRFREIPRNISKTSPANHAECRCLRKMDTGGVLYVARVSNVGLAMARPCCRCAINIQSRYISKVYYTINNQQYGIWYPNDDVDVIKSIA